MARKEREEGESEWRSGADKLVCPKDGIDGIHGGDARIVRMKAWMYL